MVEYLITFSIGLIASILSGIAGGGAGLITSPLFILLGMPPQVAIATAKFGGLGITLGGFFTFRKTKYIKWNYVVLLSVLAIIASIIGSLLLINIDETLVQKIIGFVMLGSLPFLFIKKNSGLVEVTTSFFKRTIGSMLYFCISVLQAGFGGGIGTLIPIVLTHLFGFTQLESNATRKIPGMLIALVSLSIFMASSIVDYGNGMAIFAGTYVGSSIGTRIAIKQGDTFVKWVLTGVILLLSIKLLLF